MDYLYCACPVLHCPNKNVSYWYHHKCGSKTMIRYADIEIICSGCDGSGIMFEWNFSCKEHGFKPASKQGCLFALAILGQHYGAADQILKATKKLTQLWPE